MDLGGTWRAAPADDELRRLFATPDHPDRDWTAVTVPGHWRASPDLAHHDGPLLYRHRFDLDPAADDGSATRTDDRWWLEFDGIFSQGDVWLDGVYLGDTDGYFVPHRFEITEQARDRHDHLLAVEVGSPRPGDRDAKRTLTGCFDHGDLIARSWNAGGIWRPVSVRRTGPVAIRHFRTLCIGADERGGRLRLRAVIDATASQQLTFRTVVHDTEHVHEQPVAAGENRVEWRVDVPGVERWWPHSLGEQPLYPVTVEVLTDPDTVSDRRCCRTGFRTVRLRNWIASVNGERLYLKGAALAPTRRALGEATGEAVVADLDHALDAGLDLLRVHTHISVPALYDAADERGLLLWQDLPLHGGYARSVKAPAITAARWAVDLLGHHPSLAIWCAHDEPQALDQPAPKPAAESLAAHQAPSWNRTLLDHALRRELARSDGTRPVIPHSGVLAHLPRLDGTDVHLWFGWREGRAADIGAHLAARPRQARFVSAFGAQAVPDDADFAEPHRWPQLDWSALEEHHGLDAAAVLSRFPPDRYETFDLWARATQAHQASVVKTTVELLRRLKYRPNGGFCLFALNDAQPMIGYSVIDHAGVPKPAFAALRDACRPAIVVADPFPATLVAGDEVHVAVHVVSDRRDPLDGCRVDAVLTDPAGRHEWSWGGDVPADDCVKVGTVRWTVPVGWGRVELVLTLRADGVEATNRYVGRLPTHRR